MNLITINKKFPTEQDAIKYFEKLRFGKMTTCVYCRSKKVLESGKRYACRNCGKSFSVTVNTKLHDTRLPLKTWMMAFSIVSNAKKGLSAMQLSRDLGLHYETAWNMYHKIRDIMSIENDDVKLDDIIELDTKVVDVSNRKCQLEKKGTPNRIPELDKKIKKYKDRFKFKEGEYKKPCKVGKQKTGGGASGKKIGGAVQRDGNVIAHVIKKTSFEEIKKIIRKVNKSKSKTILLTDTAKANHGFSEIMNHISINHFKMYSYRGLNTNTIESLWDIIERQILGQHHHVNLKYLDKYVAEAVIKYNNRKHDDMFETLCKLAMNKL